MSDTKLELATLQAVRLAGIADEEGLSDRALLRAEDLSEALSQASRSRYIERGGFADLQGWLITAPGMARLAELLVAESQGAAAEPVLAAALVEFEVINAPFVDTISRWQLVSTASIQPEFEAATVTELLTALTGFGEQLAGALAQVVTLLPRFARYPAQYRLALRRAETEGLGWVSGIGILSYHVVWAELHQDLLSTAGRTRDGSNR